MVMILKIFLFVFVLLALGFACSTMNGKRSEGERVVRKIGQFRQSESRLPESLNEIGLPDSEEGPIYYKKLSENRYQVWYGTSLGESVTYDSERKSWE